MKKRNFKVFSFILGALLCAPTSLLFASEHINVKEYNLTRSDKNNSISFNVQLSNNGTSNLQLSDVTMRYYFTNEGDKENFLACDYSPVGAQNVTGEFIDTADGRYIEIGFTEDAGQLAAGQSVSAVMRAWKSDWSEFSQADDYSFNPSATDYVESKTITAYINGQLVWGVEPGNSAPEIKPEIKPEVTPETKPETKPEINPNMSMKEISDAYMKDIAIEQYCPEAHASHKNNVAYGNMIHKTYYSNTTHSNRGVNILLPANYSESKKYPVLYVLHGIFGDENAMLDSANAIKEIVGNQVANGNAKEMIVVFPNMYASTTSVPPSFTQEGTAGYDNFINDLINDLMPYMAENYSVSTERENQAIAGFSMGGRESLYIGITRPDVFGYVMAIAPAPGLVPSHDWAMSHAGQLTEDELKIANPDETPYAIMICCGTNDGVVGSFPETYHKILERNNTNHIWYTIGGAGHDATAIRSGINNFVGAIFHAEEYNK